MDSSQASEFLDFLCKITFEMYREQVTTRNLHTYVLKIASQKENVVKIR